MDRFGGVSDGLPAVVTSLAILTILATLVVWAASGAATGWQTVLLGLIFLATAVWLLYRRRRADRVVAPVLQRLTAASSALQRAESEQQIAAIAARQAAELLDTERAAFVPVHDRRLVIDRGSGTLVINPGHERGFVRDVAVSNQIANVVTQPGGGRSVALLGVPVTLGQAVAGVLVAVRDPDRPFTVTEQHVLSRLAPAVADALRSHHDLRRQSEASRDRVTGFSQRSQLEADLRRVDRRQASVALALLDVDHFRRMIEDFGPTIEDQVVATVADVLRAQVREHDAIYRFDADEFCVLLRNMRSDKTLSVLNRIREAIKTIVIPGGAPGEDTQVTVSIGVAFVYPSDPERALHAASDAVADATAAGGDRVVIGTDSPFDGLSRTSGHTPARRDH